MLPDPGHLGLEILNAARRWARTRVMLRRVLDSKAASPERVHVAKQAYNKTSQELEILVGRLERVLVANGRVVPMTRRQAAPFPWQQLFGMIAAGAQAAERAVSAPLDATPAKVIDVDAETD